MLVSPEKDARSFHTLWKQAKRAAEAGAAGVIIVNTTDERLRVTNNKSGYLSDIPVLVIRKRDAKRLRKQGRRGISVLIQSTSAWSPSDVAGDAAANVYLLVTHISFADYVHRQFCVVAFRYLYVQVDPSRASKPEGHAAAV